MKKQFPSFPAGYYAEILPMTFGNFRIVVTDGTCVEDGW